MKKFYSFIAFLVSFILFFSICSQPVYAAVSTTARDWYYTKSKGHKTPVVSESIQKMLKKYNGYYVYNTGKKVVYLTFDFGYDNGYTAQILDVLKEHEIKASFFVCKAFIDQDPEGLKRMVEEGHVVGNHTVNHIPFYKLSESKIKTELKRVETAYKEVTGEKMAKIVRPPSGGYSENSLAITKKLGYTTVFWSIALPNDWNLDNQPSKETALGLFKGQSHKGAIILLHGVSPTVADNLDAMVTQLEDAGYEFRLVTDMVSGS